MSQLTVDEIKQYNKDGYIAPINVLTKEDAFQARNEIELIEKKMPDEIDNSGRYNVHLISPKLDKIVHNSNILDTVESIIGKNILVCSTTLFIKNAYQKCNIPLESAISMATLYPAEYLGISDYLGQIKKDFRADLVHFNSDFKIQNVWVEGNLINRVQS